ncbi:hypothetical protein KR032_010834 [Drosophila birchii]|nr:hypothetical protein KR032_010834 [Drosophila birchii]
MKFDRIICSAWSFVFIINLLCDSEALFKFTNIKCNCFEQSFCEFKKCELKVLGRGIVGLNLYAKVNQLPIKNTKVVLALFRRFNGYRPFLFNVSVDLCFFLKHKKRFPFVNLVYEGIQNFTNANHSCPFNHDIIIDHMVLGDKMVSKAPVPNGFYKLSINAQTDGVWRGEVDVHAEVNLGFDR